MTHTQRAELIYSSLVEDFFENPGAGGELPKNFCIRGESVNDLPHLRHLASLPFEIMLDLRTPSQYDPINHLPSESERNSKVSE